MCADVDLVEGTVVFRLTMVCTAYDRTFNALIFTIFVHLFILLNVVHGNSIGGKNKKYTIF